MDKKRRRGMWTAAIATALSAGALAWGQGTASGPFKGLFANRVSNMTTVPATDGNRLMEIQVELAWLSDARTFPYYLEAHIKSGALEIKGYVPNKAAHQQALDLAKLNCPLPVNDFLKEHASLAVRPTYRSPDQLQGAVQTTLREAFPSQRLNVLVHPNGTVEISGPVRSMDQKLAVSQSLRRLHGCTSVTNMTEVVRTESVAASKTETSVAKMTKSFDPGPSTPVETKRKGIFGLFAKSQATPTPVRDSAPTVRDFTSSESKRPPIQTVSGTKETTDAAALGTPNAGTPGNDNRPSIFPALDKNKPAQVAPAGGDTATAAQLRKLVEAAAPGTRSLVVTFTSKTDLHIECSTRPGEDAGAVAGQILSIRELQPYKVDLQMVVGGDRK